MSTYRSQSEKVKVKRREPAPEPAKIPAAKKYKKPNTHGVFRLSDKTDSLIYRLCKPNKPWAKFPSKEAAEAWIEKKARTYSFVPKDSDRNIQQLQDRERKRWVIKEL